MKLINDTISALQIVEVVINEQVKTVSNKLKWKSHDGRKYTGFREPSLDQVIRLYSLVQQNRQYNLNQSQLWERVVGRKLYGGGQTVAFSVLKNLGLIKSEKSGKSLFWYPIK